MSSEDNSLGEVCFDNLGCFSVRDCPVTGKWVNSLPDKPSNINTTFTLNTLVPSVANKEDNSIPDSSPDGNNTVNSEIISEKLISYDDLESP